jgi:phage tail sheath protein FI
MSKEIKNTDINIQEFDGNSNISQRLKYIEKSVQLCTKAFAYMPNDADTWEGVKSMISSFLTRFWKQGGLVGSKASDAFSVSVDSTRTEHDILNGIMKVILKVNLQDNSKLTELTFHQEMQKE